MISIFTLLTILFFLSEHRRSLLHQMTWQSHLADRTWGSKSRLGILPLVMILEAVAPIFPCAAWSLNHSRVLLRREGGMFGIVSA